ncbi:unannotated protein [freshwater metagenome]|uniref:Unannotated protein n=1 Tax=freshwater metagenome TaxID=449393 RepID=A0A6J7AM64_9ZZZZ
MTTRLSISNFAGTERTLVAVGTARLASMLVTTRAAGPLSADVVEVVEVVAVNVAVGGTGGAWAAGIAMANGDWSLGE